MATHGQSAGALALAAAAVAVAFGPTLGLVDARVFLPYDDEPNFVEVDGWRSGSWHERLRFALTTTRGYVYEPLAWLLKSAQFEALGLSPTRFAAVSAMAPNASAWQIRADPRSPAAGQGGCKASFCRAIQAL